MKGFKLNIEQKKEIHNVFFSDVQFFNCVQDKDDNWFLFLSENEIELISELKFAWILELKMLEFSPKKQVDF